jgi:hypothetical protein
MPRLEVLQSNWWATMTFCSAVISLKIGSVRIDYFNAHDLAI